MRTLFLAVIAIDEARKHPAAHPDVIVTSSEKGMGIPQLRAAVLESVTA